MGTKHYSVVQSQVLRADHKKLLDLSKRLHTKPGMLASVLMEIYAKPNNPDLDMSRLVVLGMANHALGQLAQRISAFDEFVKREEEMAGSDTEQKSAARAKQQEFAELLELIHTEADLCQGIAAGLVSEIPEELLPDQQTAQKMLESGPLPGDVESGKMIAYLSALRILS